MIVESTSHAASGTVRQKRHHDREVREADHQSLRPLVQGIRTVLALGISHESGPCGIRGLDQRGRSHTQAGATSRFTRRWTQWPPRKSGTCSKTHGHVIAVDDLSVTIDHGEGFALLSPNGAGKSTAVRSPVFGYLWSSHFTLWPTQRAAEAPSGGDERAPLMGTRRRLLRGVLAATALGWAAVGLLLGLMIALPTPNLGLLLPSLVLDAPRAHGRHDGALEGKPSVPR